MPVKTGGKRQKRNKKGNSTQTVETKTAPVCEEGQIYAFVTKMLGDRRLLVKRADGTECQCHIPGKFKGKRYWVSTGMLVLLNVREDDKSDVIYVYNNDEVRLLKRRGELKAFEERSDSKGNNNEVTFDQGDSDTSEGVKDINLDDL